MSQYVPYLIVIVKCLAAILVGVLFGNGAVYFFNKMPAKWFCDYGEEPSEELKDRYTQRIKSYPWKWAFTMLFIAMGIWLAIKDWRFAIPAICVIWILTEISISDIKYRIIPDQLVILLAVSAVGFIAFQGSWKDCLIGAVLGFGIMGFIALMGRMIYKKEALGGGDIKLFACLGLISGVYGVLAIFVMTTLISAAHCVWLLARKKIKRTDTLPMAPYIAIATAIYMLFLWGRLELLLSL